MENSSPNQQHFENEEIQLDVHYHPDCFVEFHAKCSGNFASMAHKKALKSVAKEVSIPGFRKGKAPESVIIKGFPQALEDAWQKELANLMFNACQKLANIPTLNGNAKVSFDSKHHSLSGAELVFSFETEPKIPHVKPEDIHLKEEPLLPVNEGHVDSAIDRIRSFYAKSEPILDRAVAEGDLITVDVDVIEDEQPKRAFSNTRLTVSNDHMARWMKDLVLGMVIGESREGVSVADEEASEEDRAHFSPKKVLVTIKSIDVLVPPPFDDELAKKVGVADTDTMKQKLKDLLKFQFESARRGALREHVVDALLSEKYYFDLPKSLMQKEIEHRLKQYRDANPKAQLSPEERENMAQDVQLQSGRALRLFYLARKLIADYRIHISPEELQTKKPATLLDAMFAESPEDENSKSQENQGIAFSRLMLNKAQDFIIDKVLERVDQN